MRNCISGIFERTSSQGWLIDEADGRRTSSEINCCSNRRRSNFKSSTCRERPSMSNWSPDRARSERNLFIDSTLQRCHRMSSVLALRGDSEAASGPCHVKSCQACQAARMRLFEAFFFFAELGYIFTSHPMTTKIMLILTAPNTTFSAEAGPITADVHMPSACLVHA